MAATALVPVHWIAPASAASPTLPTGGSFTAGAGAIAQSGAALTVNQTSNRAVVDWQNFSIGAGGKVTFNNGAGATLNRVTGAQQSQIAGSLSATGSVYLINPNGVLVLPSGKIVTGGDFVASSLGPGTSAFMQGGSLTMAGTSQASVINNGDIVSQRGNVMLIARDVASTGSISAPAGTAALVAAQQVVLMESRPGNAISVEVPGGDVTASGAIKAASVRLNAAGGNIYALAGNNGGLIEATGTANREGRVWLSAGGDVTVQGTVAATGKVGVRAGGTAAVSGKIASSGTSGVGGLIDINAGKVILSGATLNASGTTKGGTIALGGVKDSAKAAGTVVVDAASTLLANGGDAGNGGSVSLWSTALTDFKGTIQARGGSIGVGGSAEVSSAGDLGFAGTVKLDGGAGLGRLLLDPGSVVIQAGGTTTFSNAAGSLDPVALVDALASADLTVAAGGGGLTVFSPVSWSTAGKLTLSSTGNLVQQAALTQSAPIGTVGGITLIADGAIYVRSNITGTGGVVNVVVNSSATGSGGGIVVSDNGAVSIVTTGNVALGGGTALDGSGYAYGNGPSFNGIGITLQNATTIAAGGAVTLRGRGGSNSANPDYGISVFNGTIVGGSVTLDGISGSASASAFGVVLGNYGFLFNGATQTVTVRATTGDLVVTGEAAPTLAGGNSKPGISVNTNATLTADNGSIDLRGTNSSSGTGAVGGITFGAGDTISAGTSIGVWGSAAAGSPVAIALAGTLRTTGTFGGIGIYGDRISLGGTIVTPGSVAIQAVDAAWDINVGSAVKTTARTLELSSAEVQAISAGALTIGAMAAGTLTVSAPVALTTVGNFELIAGGQIVQSAPLSLSIPAANVGTIAMVAGRDIFIGANLTGAGGTVDVLANANALGSGGGITVGSMNGTPSEIAAGTATLTAVPVTISTTGDIVLGGGTLADGSGYAVGLNSFAQIGVAILTGASVVAGGAVAMRGVGGPGSFGYGIDLFAGTISGSSVTLAGTLTAGGSNGIGVFIGDYGFIEAAGAPTSTSVTATAGDITIAGDAKVASASASYNAGVFLYQSTSLNAPNGSIQIRGTVGPSGTVGGTGIWEWATAGINAGRTIGLWGLSTAPTPLSIFLTGSQTVTGAGGEIDLAGDFIRITGPISAASGTVSIQPVTPGRAIAVGASSYINAGTLSLVTADLGYITAETLTVGSPSVGGLTVAGPVAFGTVGNLQLIGGSTLTMGAPLSLAIPAGTSGEIDLIAQDDIYISSNIVGTGGTVSLLVNSDASGLGGGIAIGAFNSAPSSIPGLVAGNPIYTGGTALISMGGSVTLGGGTDGTGIGYAIGNAGFAQMGIALIRGATIVAGGAVSIRGAAVAGPAQYGIDMIGAGVTGSSVTMVGIGDGIGIAVGDQATTSRILATSGYVSMFGAPMTTGNVGVLVTGAGAIAAPNGSVFIQANGPTAIDLLASSAITASGVILLSGSSAASSGLALNLLGTLGQAGITTEIDLFGDRIAIGGPIAATNRVLIRPTTAAWDVNLGSVVKTTANQLELSAAELQSIVTGTLTIAAPSGNLYETAPIALSQAGNLDLAAGGSIVARGALSLTIPGANTGHIDLVAGRNIDILASVIGGGGTVSILANANADPSSGGGGIVVGGYAGGPVELAAYAIGNQTGASVLLSATGDITLGGGTLGDGSGFALGLTGLANTGIATLAGVTIAAAGTVALRGQGAPSAGYPFGIDIANGTITGKSIFFDGLAGAGSSAGVGIQVTDANFDAVVAGAVARTTLIATGGDLTIVGASPISGPFQPGLLLANGSTLSAPNGSVRLYGTGGAGSASNVGVATGATTAISAGQTIAITGTTGAPGTLAINLGGPLTASGTGGEIDLIGDRIAIGGPIAATGLVSIQPWTPGWHLDIGSTAKNTSATLELLPAEIGSITAGTLSLGSSLSGDLALVAPIALTQVGNVTFETHGDLTQYLPLSLAIPVGHVGTIGLIAGGDIFIRGNIAGSGGMVDLLVNSNKTGAGGGITIGGFTGSTTAQTDGGGEAYTGIPLTINLTGNATLGGGAAGDGSGYAVGLHSIWKMGIVMTPAVTLNAGGAIALRGEASGAATYGYGIEMQQNDTIVGSSVSLFGRSPASAVFPHGLNIGDGAGISVIRATAGDVLLVGEQTGSLSVNPLSIGAVFGPQATVVATNGAIDLFGAGAVGIFTYGGSTLSAFGGVALTGSRTAIGSMGLSLAGSIVSLGEGGSVVLTADAMALGGPIVTSGQASIQPLSGGVGIDLGTTDKSAVGTLQLSAAELAGISAAELAIGSATSGAMTVSAPIALTAVGNLTLETGSVLHVNAPLSLTTPAGTTGTMSLIAWNDIFIDGNISGSGGTVNLLVNANTSGDGGGIEVGGAGSAVNIGVTGNLTFGGGVAGDGSGYAVGLNTTEQMGILLNSGATIVAGGFAQFRGQGGGSGTFSYGVDVFDASVTAGSISIHGLVEPTIAEPIGVMISDGVGNASLTAVSGDITLVGGPAVFGGTPPSVGAGVWFNSASTVTAPNGSVRVIGSGAVGVNIVSPAATISAGATISVNGTATTPTGLGIAMGGALAGLGAATEVDLIGDRISIGGTIVTPGTVAIETTGSLTNIDLGSTGKTAANTLELSAAELARIQAGTLGILTSGTMSLTADLNTVGNIGTLGLQALGGIVQTAGSISANALAMYGASAQLANPNNAIGTVAALAGGAIDIAVSGPLTVGTVLSLSGVSTSGPVTLEASGVVTLNAEVVSSNAVGDAAIISGSALVNQIGGAAISTPAGRWLVFTPNAGAIVANGLAGTDWVGTSLASYRSGAAVGAGNRFVIATPGTLTVTPDSIFTTYGTTVTPTYSVTGLLPGDSLSAALSGTPVLGSPGIAAGVYSIGAAPGSLVSLENYVLAFVPGTATIARAPLTVTAGNVTTTYGQAQNPTVGYSGFQYADNAALLGGALSFSGQGINAGTYAVTPGGLTSSNYAISYVPGTLTVNPAPLTVVTNALTTTYGQAQNLTVGYTGLQYSDTAASFGGGLSFSGQGINVGTYSVLPSGLTSGNYAISYVPGTLTVNPAPLTVVTNAVTTTYGQAPNLTAGYIGLQYLDTAASLGGALAFSGQGIGVGAYSVLPSGLTSSNYTISYVPGTLTVNKAALTIATNDLTTTYGQAPNLTAAYTGFQYSDNPASLGGTLGFAGQGIAAGAYTVTPSGVTSANYAISFVPGTLTINRAPLTVVTNALTTTYGQAQNLTAGYIGLQYLDTAASLGGALAFSGQGIGAGTYSVLPSGLTSGNYAISFVPGTLTVNKAALTIATNDLTTTYGQALNLTAAYTGFQYNDTPATLGGTLGFVGQGTAAGAYTVTPAGVVSPNYAISFVPGTLTVNRAPLTVQALDVSKPYGTLLTFDGTGFSATGLIGNDTVRLATLSSIGATTTAGLPDSPYTIDIAGAQGVGLANYAISYLPGRLTIIPPLTTPNIAATAIGALSLPVVLPPAPQAPAGPAPVQLASLNTGQSSTSGLSLGGGQPILSDIPAPALLPAPAAPAAPAQNPVQPAAQPPSAPPDATPPATPAQATPPAAPTPVVEPAPAPAVVQSPPAAPAAPPAPVVDTPAVPPAPAPAPVVDTPAPAAPLAPPLQVASLPTVRTPTSDTPAAAPPTPASAPTAAAGLAQGDLSSLSSSPLPVPDNVSPSVAQSTFAGRTAELVAGGMSPQAAASAATKAVEQIGAATTRSGAPSPAQSLGDALAVGGSGPAGGNPALGAALARGMTPEQALANAGLAARTEAAMQIAARVPTSPADTAAAALANNGIPSDVPNPSAFALALASGKSPEAALRASQAAARTLAEMRERGTLPETSERQAASGLAGGELGTVPGAGDNPAAIAAYAAVLARGGSLDEARAAAALAANSSDDQRTRGSVPMSDSDACNAAMAGGAAGCGGGGNAAQQERALQAAAVPVDADASALSEGRTPAIDAGAEVVGRLLRQGTNAQEIQKLLAGWAEAAERQGEAARAPTGGAATEGKAAMIERLAQGRPTQEDIDLIVRLSGTATLEGIYRWLQPSGQGVETGPQATRRPSPDGGG